MKSPLYCIFLVLFSLLAYSQHGLSVPQESTLELIAQGEGLIPTEPRQSPQANKLVFAHFMLSNAIHFTHTDWMEEIRLAASKGFDGFALNIGRERWYIPLLASAYHGVFAAGLSDTFKLFVSLDMSSIPCSSPADIAYIQSLVFTFSSHPAQAHFKGQMLVSSFSGEGCTFGRPSVDEGWRDVLKSRTSVPVHFIPAFFAQPTGFPELTSIDGAFNWNGGWPLDNRTISFRSDEEYLSHLNGLTYMAPISPWFFSHFGPDTFDKNWIYQSNYWLILSRWELLFEHRDQIDIVQFISWNDFGESHYLTSNGNKPFCESYVNGFDHQGWMDLSQYYITAFKTGDPPAVTRDRLFLWARLYPAAAHAPDPLGRPARWELAQDMLWVVAALVEPARVMLCCGELRRSVHVPAGLRKISLRLEQDKCQVEAWVIRGHQLVMYARPPGFIFDRHPSLYNFNAIVHATP